MVLVETMTVPGWPSSVWMFKMVVFPPIAPTFEDFSQQFVSTPTSREVLDSSMLGKLLNNYNCALLKQGH